MMIAMFKQWYANFMAEVDEELAKRSEKYPDGMKQTWFTYAQLAYVWLGVLTPAGLMVLAVIFFSPVWTSIWLVATVYAWYYFRPIRWTVYVLRGGR